MLRLLPLRARLIAIGVASFIVGFSLAAQEPAGGDPVIVDGATEQTIHGALRFLASQQQASGAWTGGDGRRGEHPVAMTGYVLLAFMACGHLPEEGDYARHVAAGMDFLLDSLQPDGSYRGVDGGKYMYNHGIATIALSELYGQTRSPGMRVKLDRAIQLIVRTQSDRGEHRGGWRYRPQPGDADISVTVLQVVALRSAKNGGIAVPQATIDEAIDYVKRCRAGASGGFSYQAGHGEPGFARTAAAIYSLQVCGLYDDPLVKAGSAYLFENADRRQSHWTYGCNYAGPAQYMIGGETWRRWYGLQKEELLGTAQRDGEKVFWRGEVGPVYCTAAHTTILAMPSALPSSLPTLTGARDKRMNEKRNAANGLALASSRFLTLLVFKSVLLIVSSFPLRGAVVHTFTGQTYRGPAVLSDAIEISAEEGPVKVAIDQIFRASFADAVVSGQVPAGLVLTNGTRLAGSLGALGGATIELPNRGLRIRAAQVAWIVYSPFPPAFAANLPAGRAGALLPGGDFFEGMLKGADSAQCKLLNPIFGLRTFDVRRGELHALVLKDAQAALANFEVRAVDGSVYFADSVAPLRGNFTLRGAHFETLSLKPEEIAELRAGSARYLPLTQLKPARATAPERFAIDKTMAGEAFVGDDGSLARGIESAVGEAGAWELPAGFTALSVRVRVPADVPPIHKLTFVVYADGRAVFRSPVLTSQDAAVALRAPLGTARSLALRVEGAPSSSATVRGIWIEPTLLRR